MENQAKDLENELDKACDINYQNDKMNVYKKIFNVMNKVNYLSKDGEISIYGASYKYLSEEKITSAIRQAMIEEKLVLFPVKMSMVFNEKTEKNNKIVYKTSIVVSYKIVDIEDNSFIIVEALGEGQDYGDKGIYKAMTGAFKYAQRETFMIPTGDDPDKDVSEPISNKPSDNKNDSPVKNKPQVDINSSYDQLLLYLDDPSVSDEDRTTINLNLNASLKAQEAYLKYLDKKYGGKQCLKT